MGSGGQRSIKKRPPATVASKAAQPQAVQNLNPKTADEFSNLSADQQMQVIQKALSGKAAGSFHSYDTPFQKFINNSGLDGKPQLVDSDTFDKADGIEVYRTVKTNQTYSAMEVATKVAKDDNFLFNADGGAAYGKGVYVTPSIQGSIVYGRGATGKNVAVMRFKIKPEAKIINYTDLINLYNSEKGIKGSIANKLDGAIPADTSYFRRSDNHIAIFALSKGYSVVTLAPGRDQKSIRRNMIGNDTYTMVLSRKAVIMDENIKTRARKPGTLGYRFSDFRANGKVK